MAHIDRVLSGMFLRAWAQTQAWSVNKSLDSVREDAVYKVCATLTAPPLALAGILWLVANHLAPGIVRKDSWVTVVWFGCWAAASGWFYLRLLKHFRAFAVTPELVAAHGTPQQRFVLILEFLFGVACMFAIVVAAWMIKSR